MVHSEEYLRKQKEKAAAGVQPSGTVTRPGVEELPLPSTAERKEAVVEKLRGIEGERTEAKEKKTRKHKKKDSTIEVEAARAEELEEMKTLYAPLVSGGLQVLVEMIPLSKPKPIKEFESDIVTAGVLGAMDANFDDFKKNSWKVLLVAGLALIFIPRALVSLKEYNDKKKTDGRSDIRKDGERKILPYETITSSETTGGGV